MATRAKFLAAAIMAALVSAALLARTAEGPSVEPVTPGASPPVHAVLDWLAGLPDAPGGRRVATGFFGGYSNHTFGMDQVTQVRDLTGRFPAILSCDYGAGWATAADPTTLIDYTCNGKLKEWWRAGGLVTVSFHPPTPGTSDGGGLNKRLVEFADLTDRQSEVGRRWHAYLDKVAAGLRDLQHAGVPVLFRPLHEMNGNPFWWSGQDPGTFQSVWRDLYAYLTRDKGLSNLIWIFSPIVGPGDLVAYYPGPSYVDIAGLDAYDEDPLHPAIAAGYEQLVALGKPFAFTEIGPDDYHRGSADYRKWLTALRDHYSEAVYVLCWNDDWGPHRNPGGAEFMADDLMLTRDKVPRL